MTNRNQVRITDYNRIRNWLDQHGENGWAKLLAQGLQPWTIDRIIKGKQKSAPRTLTRRAFSLATGMPEDVLFPVVEDRKEMA